MLCCDFFFPFVWFKFQFQQNNSNGYFNLVISKERLATFLFRNSYIKLEFPISWILHIRMIIRGKKISLIRRTFNEISWCKGISRSNSTQIIFRLVRDIWRDSVRAHLKWVSFKCEWTSVFASETPTPRPEWTRRNLFICLWLIEK